MLYGPQLHQCLVRLKCLKAMFKNNKLATCLMTKGDIKIYLRTVWGQPYIIKEPLPAAYC